MGIIQNTSQYQTNITNFTTLEENTRNIIQAKEQNQIDDRTVQFQFTDTNYELDTGTFYWTFENIQDDNDLEDALDKAGSVGAERFFGMDNKNIEPQKLSQMKNTLRDAILTELPEDFSTFSKSEQQLNKLLRKRKRQVRQQQRIQKQRIQENTEEIQTVKKEKRRLQQKKAGLIGRAKQFRQEGNTQKARSLIGEAGAIQTNKINDLEQQLQEEQADTQRARQQLTQLQNLEDDINAVQ